MQFERKQKGKYVVPDTFRATLANDHKCVDKCSADGKKKLLDSPPLMTPCIITISQLLTNVSKFGKSFRFGVI